MFWISLDLIYSYYLFFFRLPFLCLSLYLFLTRFLDFPFLSLFLFLVFLVRARSLAELDRVVVLSGRA